MIHPHHFLKEKHTEKRCPYCNIELNGNFIEEFFGEYHYHRKDCICGKIILLRQNHQSTRTLDSKL